MLHFSSFVSDFVSRLATRFCLVPATLLGEKFILCDLLLHV